MNPYLNFVINSQTITNLNIWGDLRCFFMQSICINVVNWVLNKYIIKKKSNSLFNGIPPLYLCENAVAAAWILELTTSQQMMQGALCWSDPLSERENEKNVATTRAKAKTNEPYMTHNGNLNKEYLQMRFNSFYPTTIWLLREISFKLQYTFYIRKINNEKQPKNRGLWHMLPHCEIAKLNMMAVMKVK